MSKILILDVETTTSHKGNPFDLTNKLVCIGTKWKGEKPQVSYLFKPVNRAIKEADLIVGFNIKFDLHWLRKVGYNIENITVWDCQIAEFLLECQEKRYISLDDTLLKYNLPPKLDIVKTEYWDKGIDTDAIPREVLTEYLEKDLICTELVFERQLEQFQTTHTHLFPLFKLCCQDLLVLEEMEWNGIKFDAKKAISEVTVLHAKLQEIKCSIDKKVGDIPYSLSSDYHLSAILYGGVILEDFRVPIGVYKTGEKIGQPRYSIHIKKYECDRLVEPLKGTESHEKVSKKELIYVEKGVLTEVRKFWEVNEDILKQLKPNGKAKELINSIIEYNKIDKLCNTYLLGWSNLIKEMNWEEDTLHPQLNQCVAITGRLSSSKPNGQNADKATKSFCGSRYESSN
jgi:DNA polymerase I-like protein with 3'-5' exonuclease and polymerase domains